MNTLKWAIAFFFVAIVAAVLGFVANAGGIVTELSRFGFFLFTALFVILGLTHAFLGDSSRFGH